MVFYLYGEAVEIKTYQDLLAVGESENNRQEFFLSVINEHKNTPLYRTAQDADLYMRQLNPTIRRYKKLLYTISGKAVPDNFSANHKCASNFFNRFITQENQYLLSNGVTFDEESTKEKLGGTDFDYKIQRGGKLALCMGVSFGFFNLDHIEIFNVLEFAPLYDEIDGSIKAGIRFWQIDNSKPLRFTVYELDGYTEYLKNEDKVEILKEKRPYKLNIKETEADGTEIYGGENYPTFPIIPLFANEMKQSELVGLRENIDCYDLIKSGFANDLDDASMIYWTLSNAGGMDDIDLVKFIEHMRTVKAAVVDTDGASAEAHTMDVPYQSRETYLTRLENDMYNDFMALNVNQVSAGNVTATAITAAYDPMDNKVNEYEYCVTKFIMDILKVAGIEDVPTYTRSRIANKGEEITTLLQSAEYLPSEYVTEKILNILGDADRLNEILDKMTYEEAERFTNSEESAEVVEE